MFTTGLNFKSNVYLTDGQIPQQKMNTPFVDFFLFKFLKSTTSLKYE